MVPPGEPETPLEDAAHLTVIGSYPIASRLLCYSITNVKAHLIWYNICLFLPLKIMFSCQSGQLRSQRTKIARRREERTPEHLMRSLYQYRLRLCYLLRSLRNTVPMTRFRPLTPWPRKGVVPVRRLRSLEFDQNGRRIISGW